MDITSSTAAQLYTRSKDAMAPQGSGPDFLGAARSFAQTIQEGEAAAQAAMTGGADPHALVEALAQTELAVETAVTVRNKVVEAYQEILRMPV
ncbi:MULTISPECIES: flagellar hook-basal body complex protein FliE [unclassified Dinoroseobacter]|uniref:flagellar hook-basal body complex protein FliE n=1 Tax=unclassified Dinoroseobacter TaxID=2620028 RepID=UPI003C7D87FF